jgi:ABC-type transport system involved in multi-copper enzyme maturation permease subunit
MAWVTWRQHRVALASVTALLGALAVWLWLAGLRLHHAYAAAIACHTTSSLACQNLVNTFNNMDDFLANGFILQAVPVLIGAFAGAPVLARELETGTFRYAWTLGIGRWRWALAKLVPLAIVLATAAGALGVLLSWYYQPYFNDANQNVSLNEVTPFFPGLFDLHGVTFAAWTLAAFAIGALAGMLIRRVVPAIVATLASYTGLACATDLLLRQHYLTPLLTSNPDVPSSAWIMSQWWTRGGTFAFVSPPDSLLNQFCSALPPDDFGRKPKVTTLAECIAQHGYTQWTRYQPASRFWPFQWIEGGWLLALSALLIAATIWLVRRRAA